MKKGYLRQTNLHNSYIVSTKCQFYICLIHLTLLIIINRLLLKPDMVNCPQKCKCSLQLVSSPSTPKTKAYCVKSIFILTFGFLSNWLSSILLVLPKTCPHVYCLFPSRKTNDHSSMFLIHCKKYQAIKSWSCNVHIHRQERERERERRDTDIPW